MQGDQSEAAVITRGGHRLEAVGIMKKLAGFRIYFSKMRWKDLLMK